MLSRITTKQRSFRSVYISSRSHGVNIFKNIQSCSYSSGYNPVKISDFTNHLKMKTKTKVEQSRNYVPGEVDMTVSKLNTIIIDLSLFYTLFWFRCFQIIGGGAIGLSAAYFLKSKYKKAVSVAVVEKDPCVRPFILVFYQIRLT